jgi:putative ATP-binding cassette transporter
MILLTLFSGRISGLVSFWQNGFYSAMQKLDGAQVRFHIDIFGVPAAIHVASALLNHYVQQAFGNHWRIWCNAQFTNCWPQQQPYFRGEYVERPVDSPDQRISKMWQVLSAPPSVCQWTWSTRCFQSRRLLPSHGPCQDRLS